MYSVNRSHSAEPEATASELLSLPNVTVANITGKVREKVYREDTWWIFVERLFPTYGATTEKALLHNLRSHLCVDYRILGSSSFPQMCMRVTMFI